MHRWAFSKHDLGWRFREQSVGSPSRCVSRKVRQERAEKWGLDEAASSAGSRAEDQVQGQQAAILSEVRISRRRQGVQGNAIPDRQSLEVDRGNYEVGRRNFVAWSIWTILHLPFTGTSKRPAAAVQVSDSIDQIRLLAVVRHLCLEDCSRRMRTLNGGDSDDRSLKHCNDLHSRLLHLLCRVPFCAGS